MHWTRIKAKDRSGMWCWKDEQGECRWAQSGFNPNTGRQGSFESTLSKDQLAEINHLVDTSVHDQFDEQYHCVPNNFQAKKALMEKYGGKFLSTLWNSPYNEDVNLAGKIESALY